MTRSANIVSPASSRETALLGAATVAFLAFAAAFATSTSYVIQPELTGVADDLGSTVPVVSGAAGSAIVGYLVGLAFLVPLVDQVRSNRLIAGQLAGLAAGLLLAAAAPNPLTLGAGLFVSGMCASTGAQMSTLAGKHSSPSRRGLAVGSVTAGISAGILLGRIMGGALTDRVGWRSMLAIFATGRIAVAMASLGALPNARVAAPQSYLAVIRSMPALLKSNRRLRTSAVSGALWFSSFSLTWVVGDDPATFGLGCLPFGLGELVGRCRVVVVLPAWRVWWPLVLGSVHTYTASAVLRASLLVSYSQPWLM